MSKIDTLFLGVLVGILAGTALILVGDEHPTAIDVYRGKTTLEITYKDSIAVDSIVVFKNLKWSFIKCHC